MNTTWTKLICATGILAGACAGIVACEVTVTDDGDSGTTDTDATVADSGTGSETSTTTCPQAAVDPEFQLDAAVPSSKCIADKCCAAYTACHINVTDPDASANDDTCADISRAVVLCQTAPDAGPQKFNECINSLKASYRDSTDAATPLLQAWETMNNCLLDNCSN